MSRALLVDYAGVLTEPLEHVYARFASSERVRVEALVAALMSLSAPIHRFETGALPATEMESLLASRLARTAGRAVTRSGLLLRFAECFARDEAVWDSLRSARASGIRLGLLTNSWLRETYPPDDELAELFDVVIMSRDVGLRKPDLRIFALALEQLGVSPDECLFVDDATQNVVAAKSYGIPALLYTGQHELLEALS